MSQDGSWRRSTWTPLKPFESSVISKQAGRWESTGVPFNSPTRTPKLPDWHLRHLSRRQLSHLIVFLPLNPEEFTTLGEPAQSINCAVPVSIKVQQMWNPGSAMVNNPASTPVWGGPNSVGSKVCSDQFKPGISILWIQYATVKQVAEKLRLIKTFSCKRGPTRQRRLASDRGSSRQLFAKLKMVVPPR